MMNTPTSITLSQFNQTLSQIVGACRPLQYAWVTAETSDVRSSGGHCYLELVEKDPAGRPVAKMRATIWASTYRLLAMKFRNETGQDFRSDLKVMVQVSANFHPVFGLAVNITDINSTYTLGDAMQRRMEMIRRLSAEGIIGDNRALPWHAVPQRIAVISARGAAGYGDFINQLYHNSSRLRFCTRLFEATLQGENAPASIIRALDAVHEQSELWDCVVIIRGGGASTDLLCFDNYDLAAHIAQFPIPVVIGIGHERDVTLLDYVANMRVKTPTAAAEWLISRGEAALGKLQELASGILLTVTERLSGCHRQLAYVAGQLPVAANGAIMRARARLAQGRLVLASVADRHLRPEMQRLAALKEAIACALNVDIARQRQRLDSWELLLKALSPEATLKRGYSITRCGGHTLTSASQAPDGAQIETILADGALTSIVSLKFSTQSPTPL